MTKIVSIRKVANGGYQAEMVGGVVRPGSVNILALLNKGDERFKQGSERRAWFPVTLATLSEDFNVDALTISKLNALEQGEKVELVIENPTLGGHKLCIQINETTVPDTYQRQHVMKSAKQLMIDAKIASNGKLKTDFDLGKYIGQNGYFMDADGNFIFSRGTVTIESQVSHTFVEGALVPETELANYGATLAEAPVAEAVEA